MAHLRAEDRPRTNIWPWRPDRPFSLILSHHIFCSCFVLTSGVRSLRLAPPRASSIATPDDCARRGRRQRVPRWSAERRPGFLARGPRATGPPPPPTLGSRKLGV